MPKEVTIAIIIILAVALVVLGLAVYVRHRRRLKREKSFVNLGKTAPEYHYNLKRSPMTLDENYLFFILHEGLPQDLIILPQVSLLDIIERPAQKQALSKIERKVIDYGIFKVAEDRKYPFKRLVPVLMIELDDETHRLSARVDRDMFINGLCEDIGLPIMHIQKEKTYNQKALLKQIFSYLRKYS